MTASLFGKLPSQLDYVRVAHDAPVAITFDAWLQQAVQELAKVSAAWPATTLHFVFAPQGSPVCLVGVLVDSRDRMGRKFPLSVYRVAQAGPFVRNLAALPRSAAAFFQAASNLLAARDTLQRDDLGAQLAALPELDIASLDRHGHELAKELEAVSTDTLCASVGRRITSVTTSAEKLLQALHADQSNDRSVTVGLPYGAEVQQAFWLGLVRGFLPSLFWTEPGESGRLCITRGAPAALLPLWLSQPSRRHPRHLVLEDAQGAVPDATETTNLAELVARFTLRGPH